jgi:tRNA G18 (ribose-2'-O)-methylase SpoU
LQPPIRHQIIACTSCGLRSVLPARDALPQRCPKCRGQFAPIGPPYEEHRISEHGRPLAEGFELLLDNLRSVHNVGSIFRTAEGAGLKHIHLAGITPTPDNAKLKKTALGADETVAWTYHLNGLIAARQLKEAGHCLWALEGGERAVPLLETNLAVPEKLVLVIGSEVCGVDPAILALCEQVVYLPMQGHKASLNAAVATGIAVYRLRFGH